MDNLALVRRLARMCRMTAVANMPATVLNQRGNFLDAVTWLNDAWVELQKEQPWRWMRSRFTLQTVAGQDEYPYGDFTDVLTSTPITRFSEWLVTDPTNPSTTFLTSGGVNGKFYMGYLPWAQFRTIYRLTPVQTGAPIHVTIDPQDNIVFGPVPDAVYTYEGEYQRSAQNLVADDDVPELPEDYHLLLAYQALITFGIGEAAPEQLALATTRGGVLKSRLNMDQGAVWKRSKPLA